MRTLLLLLIPAIAFAATEPVNVNTANGHIKATSSGTGGVLHPFNWGDVFVTRLPHAVTFYVDGSGSVLTTGTKHAIKIPYGGTLIGWLLLGSPSGSVTVDIYRAGNGAGLPTTSIIGAGTKPTLASSVENSSTSFVNWTSTTVNEKDNLAINLSGISTLTYLTLVLYYQ